MSRTLAHLTLTTGHVRDCARSEVSDDIISKIRQSLQEGASELGGTGWVVIQLVAPKGASIFDLAANGLTLARCWLAPTEVQADQMWPELARKHPSVPRPAAPWLAAALLPDVLSSDPARMMQLGDLERCIGWALMPDA